MGYIMRTEIYWGIELRAMQWPAANQLFFPLSSVFFPMFKCFVVDVAIIE